MRWVPVTKEKSNHDCPYRAREHVRPTLAGHHIGLILLNFGIFLSTHSVMETQGSQLGQVRAHILILAAIHPQILLTSEVRELVTDFRNHDPDDWAEMQHPNSEVIDDDWVARMRLLDDPAALQAEMDSFAGQYSQLMASSIDQRYAFVAAHPRPITYLTSTFLHGGWWHLIGNMWFLWLAGFVLEDAWGRTLYLLVYLTAGAFACQFDAWANPGSIVSSIGASGAVAGLMGAFLVRFPKMKIRMMWFFDLGLFPFSRFWMRAYWVLPIWVLTEINYGMGREGRHWTLGTRRWFPLWWHCGCGAPLLGLGTYTESVNRGKGCLDA